MMVFWKRKKETAESQLTDSIAYGFREYINNEIPTRFIDTSSLRFVSRKDVFHVFKDKITRITEADILKRMGVPESGPFTTYEPLRQNSLKQIVQEVVQYVILSHRWDEATGEPSYQDVFGGARPRNAARFKKLVEFCKTLNKMGHKLAWIDTCCIDKTSATELNEAIHAMYKWYANSCLCIAHLAGSTSIADWENEAWFTRGWTLQELLAPRQLKFYDKNWKPLITLDGVDDDRHYDPIISHLHKVTGISERVLKADNSKGVQECTFWEIMSWASRRQTTRIEDRAYSLVGLFHVNLTVVYGEGERAFPRLVKAIMAQNPSWDAFTWFGQPFIDDPVLPSSPASYPRYEAHMSEGRLGVHQFSFTSLGLSLQSLPPIPLTLGSVTDPKEPRQPYVVELRPPQNSSSGRFGNLVVECGANRLKMIRSARKLAACILNHYSTISAGMQRREESEGKLMLGKEYICFLLYSDEQPEEGSETMWTKLTSDNLLRISFVGMPRTDDGGDDEGVEESLTLPLVRILIPLRRSTLFPNDV